jgi:hypothetical protein
MRSWIWNEAALGDAEEPSVERLEVLAEDVKFVGLTLIACRYMPAD